MKFYCNLPQTEINFYNKRKKRVTVKFHQGFFETEDAETIEFLSGYQSQGVLVSKADEGEPEIDYTPVFPDDETGADEPKPGVRIKSTATGKK